MPQIHFANHKFPPLEVDPGSYLMEALRESQIPVASSCHGDAVCGRCRIHILNGHENLSEESQLEEGLRTRLRISDGQRISCQTQVYGDILIDTNYW